MSTRTTPDYRRIDFARREILEALTEFAELLRAWNAPDDEHTRYQLRRLVDDVIEETMQDLRLHIDGCTLGDTHGGPCDV